MTKIKRFGLKLGMGLLILIGLVLLAVVLGLAYLTMDEYKPAPIVPATLTSSPNAKPVNLDQSLSVLSYNIGYAGLGNEQDFFMDGGQMVSPTETAVKKNLEGLKSELNKLPADFYLLQEVDRDSKRSFNYNQINFIADTLDLGYSFANNLKVSFLPYPLPPIGKVDSGLLSLSAYQVNSATRVALPVPFKWPVRIANLKRCLLVDRIPIKDSNKELVLINLHLEAYDNNGLGRVQQTAALKAFCQEEFAKGNYVIAGGDWNQALPYSPKFKSPAGINAVWQPGDIPANYFDADWQIAVDKELPTCRLNCHPYIGNEDRTPFYAIDGFLVSPNVLIENVEVIPTDFTFADHQPVFLRFKLK